VATARACPSETVRTAAATGINAALTALIGQLRLGSAARLQAATRAYLQDRTAGDVPVLAQQSVKGLLAEAALHLLMARRQLDEPGRGERAVARGHARITGADRILLGLLGGSGYLLRGPGVDAHVSELAANVFVGTAMVPGGAW
jgi:hypothetical protein